MVSEELPACRNVVPPEDSERGKKMTARAGQFAQRANSVSRSPAVSPQMTPITPFQQRLNKRVGSSLDQESPESRKKLKYLNTVKGLFLLPNGTTVALVLDPGADNTAEGMLNRVRQAPIATGSASDFLGKKSARNVRWDGGQLTLQTLSGHIIDDSLLNDLIQNPTSVTCAFLVADGSEPEWAYENLWNVTPKPEMLGQLPQGYTLETALADQVDNALQAVWPNKPKQDERRLVSVDLGDDKISIFDTGQGMDASPENSITNWGTVGGSTHRSVHHKGIGGEPPYLKPFLGKYGAGGVAAALHLGGCVTVYSKTKKSKKVVWLRMEQKALVQKHRLDPEQGVWRTGGGIREMTKLESEKAPHGSFTRVVISKLRSPKYCIKGSEQFWKVEKVKQMLKDIYFPYIQSESASRTVTPVEFEVNGTNLLEVVDCEMAIANQHTCTGQPFVFLIRMRKPAEEGADQHIMDEANARITCQYFPIQRGKEALKTVLEDLSKLRPESAVTFETVHRVVIRWLGRLLPEAKWNMLPFMEVTPKKEQRYSVRQQWSKRVRAYVETDAGFQPNQSKLELDRDHPFTLALKELGSEQVKDSSDEEVQVELKHDSKNKTPTQLVEAYMKWLTDMHSKYDEEVTFLDEPAWVFSHPNADKELGVHKQVIVFHKKMKDTTGEWHINDQDPVRVRFVRGTAGLKMDLYATLEYFFREGDDDQGEVKILCRAIDVDDAEGCQLVEKSGRLCFELNKSQWLPGAALSGGKSEVPARGAGRLEKKLEEMYNKAPGYIDILKEEDLKKFDFSGSRSIVTKNGIKGIYSFSLGSSSVCRLTQQGTYTFLFSLESGKFHSVKTTTIRVVPSATTTKWQLSTLNAVSGNTTMSSFVTLRLNEKYKDELVLSKYDGYGNAQAFDRAMPVEVRVVTSEGKSLGMTQKVTAYTASSEGRKYGGRLQIAGLIFTCGELKLIEPSYQALLRVYVKDDQYGETSCKVLPGSLASLRVIDSLPSVLTESSKRKEFLQSENFDKFQHAMWFSEELRPGETIKRLTLQGLDTFGNKIEKGQKILLSVKGVAFQDSLLESREVDDSGCLQLGGLLNITAEYNSTGFVGVSSETGKNICVVGFRTVSRKLVTAQVPSKAFVGRDMEGVIVRIVDEFDIVDTEVDGYSHSVSLDWQHGVTFPFVKGECALPPVRLPDRPGRWRGRAFFSANPNVCVDLKVELELAPGFLLKKPVTTHEELMVVRCGSAFDFLFCVADDRGQAAVLSEAQKSSINVKSEAQSAGDDGTDLYPRPCMVTCANIVECEVNSGFYKADVVLIGEVGTYKLIMMDVESKLKGKVTYMCELKSGKVAQLVVHIHQFESDYKVVREEVRLRRYEEFPRIDVTLLDSEGNLCTYCEGKAVHMKAENCRDFKKIQANIFKCAAVLDSFIVDIPVGSYDLHVNLDTPESLSYRFRLVVEPGTDPSAVKLLDNDDVVVALGGSDCQVRLPLMRVEVKSSSSIKKVQWRRLSVCLRIESMDPVPLNIEYGRREACEVLGTAIDSLEEKKSSPMVGDYVSCSSSVIYEFRDVVAPTVAGNYSMDFFIRDCAVGSQRRQLKLTHGPPCKLDIVRGPLHDPLDILGVNLLDAHGNKCDSISGMDVFVRFALGENFKIDASTTDPDREPCFVESRKRSKIVNGQADFGPFKLTDGLPGLYVLEVVAEHPGIVPAENQILVTRGVPHESVREQLRQLSKEREGLFETAALFEKTHEQICHRQREKQFLRGELQKLKDAKTSLLQTQEAVRREQIAKDDDTLLQLEYKQRIRTEKNVIMELNRLARSNGPNAPILFLEAQSGTNFLNPGTEQGQDVVGLVALLAEVDSNLLNRALVEYLGLSTMLLMVCRTQRGVNALEEYDGHKMDESKGLHGFARSRGQRLKRFECLALADIRPYFRSDGKPSTLDRHPQKLLNIDTPTLPGSNEPPEGFLGYAVNLVHLRDEHLGEPLQLRATLFHHLLHTLQVYDTRQNMLKAKTKICLSGGAVSLDGGSIRKNQRQQLGKRNDVVPVSFANVDRHDRWGTWQAPAPSALSRMSRHTQLGREIAKRDDEISSREKELVQVCELLQGMQHNIDRFGGSNGLKQRTATVQQWCLEMQKACHLFERTGSSLPTPLSIAGTESRDLIVAELEDRRMRAFIMYPLRERVDSLGR